MARLLKRRKKRVKRGSLPFAGAPCLDMAVKEMAVKEMSENDVFSCSS